MQASVRCIYGRRGSGKSTLARIFCEDAPRVLVLDTLGEYGDRRSWRVAASRSELKRALVEGVRKGLFRIAYRIDARRANPIDEASFLADCAAAAQVNFPADPDPLLLVIDEANLAYPVEAARTDRCAALRALVLQGRHKGVGLLFITQRPANIGMDARSQAAEVFSFSLAAPNDVRAVAELAPDADRQLKLLPAFHFLRIADGKCGIMVTRSGRVVSGQRPRAT